MLGEWAADGHDAEAVELWTIGHPGSESLVSWFAGDASSLCTVDASAPEESAYSRFEAAQDDLLVIDRHLSITHHVSLIQMDLSRAENRTTLDGWVRALLE